MRCRSGLVPVAIEAAHTGVTDGKAATHSSTWWPRSSSRPSVGARPSATAWWSMAGFIASTTARTSFFAATALAEDPQPRVLLAGAAAAADHQPQERGEHEHGERWEEDA